MHLHKQHVYV